ncbi:GDP-mannose 4,6-dehydratase [Agreia sp. PsM10]|uniref:GDP-mannose 4,6-dehydratase n=1 Tax=Agreia sp. PsM10 TaxID=3030533 RepID=UPI00263B7B2D|nr:GDP-mannose 4,6-dehydratase [Agreia sp. PsM10]MDN4641990.1 GDP-mannose 4,6-dehydratase [Agreia sp. PsM10]
MPVALITGISGQDGWYLSRSLLQRGYTVHGVVRQQSQAKLDPRIEVHRIRSDSLVEISAVVAASNPDEIYNLAAISSVYTSWIEPVHTAAVNALAVAQLLESAWQLQEREGRQVRFVQASSAELFGRALSSPQTERTPIAPSSPYGAAKAYAHHMVDVYRQRGLFAASCILYNHESPRRPESFVTRKITVAAARIAAGRQNELFLGGLNTRRDWGWAPDYCEAMRLAASAADPDDFVVASGETHSIEEFVQRAFLRAGIPDWRRFVTVDSALTRPVDPSSQVGDPLRIEDRLHWRRTMSFADIVDAMVDSDIALMNQSTT